MNRNARRNQVAQDGGSQAVLQHTTAPRQVTATTVDTSASPLLKVPTVADEHAALVDAAVQPSEIDTLAAMTAPRQVAVTRLRR